MTPPNLWSRIRVLRCFGLREFGLRISAALETNFRKLSWDQRGTVLESLHLRSSTLYPLMRRTTAFLP